MNESISAIQRLLYEYPLYDYIEASGDVNIAVIGSSDFSFGFIDRALEASQVEGLMLHISLITDDENSKAEYLAARPCIKNFISVNDQVQADRWGSVSFITTDSIDKDTVSELLLSDEDTQYAYVVLGTNDLQLNRVIAVETKECLDLTGRRSCVAYLSPDTACEEGLCAITDDYTIQNHPDFKVLKEMSFNCHLLWDEGEGLNIQRLRNEFRQQYNFNSSFSNVLSVKYKLWSLGLLWGPDTDLYELAEQFEVKRNDNKRRINELIRYEHQRWCINLACDGWKPQKILVFCINGVKDKVNKFHPCLVPSDAKLHLSEPKWKENGYALWDTASASDLQQLDELDRVSVKLYREFKKQADKLLNGDSYPADDIHSIRVLIKNYPNCVLPFERFVLTVKAIANKEVSGHISQYEFNQTRFIKTLSIIPTRIRNMVKRYLNNIDALFFPVFESRRHTNYKMADAKLVKNIPFILTYRTHLRIGVPLNVSKYDMNNDMLFSNIASSIKINPSRVTYFVDYSQVDAEALHRAVDYIVKGFDVRNLQSFINIVICCKQGHSAPDDEMLNELLSLGKRVKSVKLFSYGRISELKEKLSLLITSRNYSALEENDSSAFGLLNGMGFYDAIPGYIFDSKESRFVVTEKCAYLNYINLPNHLRISDIIDLKNASENADLPELQNDYQFFWSFYKGGLWSGKEKIWKMMCRSLGEHMKKNDLLFSVTQPKEVPARNGYSWYVPQLCYHSVKQIIEGLKEYDILGSKSAIKFHTTSACRVTIVCTAELKKCFDALFSDPYDICGDVDIRITKEKYVVSVFRDTLKVKGFRPGVSSPPFTADADAEKIVENLKEFAKAGYLINLTQTEDGYDFCFSSAPIKRLLTQEGFLLEMYVYYRVLSLGYFDEVYSGAEITVNDNISNEFDLLLVKGYKSLVVEIKARTELNQDIYHKLANLTKQYGINATPVLISDTVEKEQFDNSVNEMQRSRGENYGIVTIHKFEDVKNAAEILVSIMREKHSQ